MDLTDRILDKAGREHWKIKVQNGLVSLQCSSPAMEMKTDRLVHKVPKLESRKPFASELKVGKRKLLKVLLLQLVLPKPVISWTKASYNWICMKVRIGMTESQKFEVQAWVDFPIQTWEVWCLKQHGNERGGKRDKEKPLRLMSVGTHENKLWLRGIQTFIKNSFTF